MDIERLDINAVCFGILCNFAPVCGEERAKEAAGIVRSLQAENEKLRAKLEQARTDCAVAEKNHADCLGELEQVKRLYESEKEDFIDFACSGVPNLSPYCLNRHQDCVDERGWCRAEKCRGFRRERGPQKED